MTNPPTTTAALLEAMTDRSRFEMLATSILRKAEPRYASIIQTGVNAGWETIKAPLDGLHLLPNTNPPHWVFVQHTTTDRTSLKGKWLTNANADLPKAFSEAKKIRQQVPEAKFTVVLCTNQHADVDLIRDVTVKATQTGLVPDIWEQHRLADFLDTTGDGHWLRKHFLGVEAERLSSELLRELCRCSIDNFRRMILLPWHNYLVHRGIVNDLLRTVSEKAVTLSVLSGRSGYGKSVAALQFMDEWIADGRFALWLPSSLIQQGDTLEVALDSCLQCLHPALERNAGRIALQIAAETGRLMIVVDDIRPDDPAYMLRWLFGIAAPLETDSGNADKTLRSKPADSAPAVFVVPVWPEWLQSFPKSTLNASWLGFVPVGEFTPEESANILRAEPSHLSAIEAHEWANRLGNDPFSVGLFASMIRDETDTASMGHFAEDALGQFIDKNLRVLVEQNPDAFLFTELRDALGVLGQAMLMQRNLQPCWQDIRT